MNMNRKEAPAFHNIEHIEVLQASETKLTNGIPLYTIHAGSQELVKVEFVFKAGMYYQNRTLIASAANNLMETGTTRFNALEISEKIDFYGAFLELSTGQDYASLSLYTLNKYLNETLEVLQDIILNPVFPEDEFSIYINNKKQKHLVNSQKVNVLARRKFNEMLFGNQHPYGKEVETSDFDSLQLSDVKAFFVQHYHTANCTIIATGKIAPDFNERINRFFGQKKWGQHSSIHKVAQTIPPPAETKILVEKSDALQSAIRVGRLLFNKTHPDYFHFQVLNVILGGYFGSRLMANIREDKGYTYGIGSGLTSLVHGGYFFISTEVGSGVTKNALAEIYKELDILRNQLIGDDELQTVKNYILGQMLRSIDGPFTLAEKFKGIWMFGLDYSYYDNYFKSVQQVTASQLRDLANKYLQQKDLMECVAGKYE